MLLVPLSASSPVSINPWTFIMQAINVLVVMAVLYKLMYKPLGELMRKREQEVEDSLNKASATKAEAEELFAKYKAQMDDARNQAREIIEKANKSGEAVREQIVAEARQEAERLLERARREIETEKDKAVRAVRNEMSALAVMAAEQVIRRSLKDEDHDRLVKEFLDKVGEVQ